MSRADDRNAGDAKRPQRISATAPHPARRKILACSTRAIYNHFGRTSRRILPPKMGGRVALFSPPMRSSAGSIILVLTTLLAGPHPRHNGEPMPFPPIAAPAAQQGRRCAETLRRRAGRGCTGGRPTASATSRRRRRRGCRHLPQQPLDGAARGRGQGVEAVANASARESLAIESAMGAGQDALMSRRCPCWWHWRANGSKPQVRRAAIVAIGLIGSPAAEKELLKVHTRRGTGANYRHHCHRPADQRERGRTCAPCRASVASDTHYQSHRETWPVERAAMGTATASQG
jgi:hypothetical protein